MTTLARLRDCCTTELCKRGNVAACALLKRKRTRPLTLARLQKHYRGATVDFRVSRLSIANRNVSTVEPQKSPEIADACTEACKRQRGLAA